MTNDEHAMRAAEKILGAMDVSDVDGLDVREVARTISEEYTLLDSEVREWRGAFTEFCGDPQEFLDCFYGALNLAKENQR